MVGTQAVLLAPNESAALGRQARAAVPRSAHADLNERDHGALVRPVQEGRIDAASGV
jgi:hypothetical protein